MLKSIAVKEYMVTHPVTVKPHMSVYQAASYILSNKISGVAVIDDDRNLIGMLSELDCLRAIINNVYNDGDAGNALVTEFMTTTIESNDPNDDLVKVATSMLDHKHRRRPIVVDGKLVGQLTCRQILKVMKDFGH